MERAAARTQRFSLNGPVRENGPAVVDGNQIGKDDQSATDAKELPARPQDGYDGELGREGQEMRQGIEKRHAAALARVQKLNAGRQEQSVERERSQQMARERSQQTEGEQRESLEGAQRNQKEEIRADREQSEAEARRADAADHPLMLLRRLANRHGLNAWLETIQSPGARLREAAESRGGASAAPRAGKRGPGVPNDTDQFEGSLEAKDSPSQAIDPWIPEATPAESTLKATADDRSSLEAIDRVLQNLDLGQIAFTVPDTLIVREQATVNLVMSPTQSTEALTKLIRQTNPGSNDVKTAQIHISGLMEAKLVGSAFEIQALTADEPQMVSRTEPTEWKWEIAPKFAGAQTLHLTINAIVSIDGTDRRRTIRSYDRTLRVVIARTKRSGQSILFILLTLAGVAAMVVFAVRYFTKRKRALGVLPDSRDRALKPSPDVFFSYSRKDQQRVLILAQLLQTNGIKVWIDQYGIDGAAVWAREITEAIQRAKVFVLIVSRSSIISENVLRELSLASEERKAILPLYFEDVQMPSSMRYQLAGIHYLSVERSSPQASLDSVLRALKHHGVEPTPRLAQNNPIAVD